MASIDFDVMIRDRAYEIWERAGRPLGLEHEHWARARLDIEAKVAENEPSQAVRSDRSSPAMEALAPEPVEAARLRQALYAPEPFSFELFGKECPPVDLPIILRPDIGRGDSEITARAA